jgi:hypothetical protein
MFAPPSPALFATASALSDFTTGSVGTETRLAHDLDHADALTTRNLAIAAALFLPHSYHYVSTLL